jgi:hypothetical protein
MSETDAGEDAQVEAPAEPGSTATFGGLSPREAASRRWQKEREEREATAARERDEADALFVRVPVRTAAIVKALEKAAAGGGVQAAREMRAWLTEFPPDTDDVDVRTLTSKARRAMLARLLAEEDEVVSTM